MSVRAASRSMAMSAQRFRHAEKFDRERVEAGGERAGLGIDEALRQRCRGLLAARGEAGEPLRQLIGDPAVEIVESFADGSLSLGFDALPLGCGARGSLGIDGLLRFGVAGQCRR